MKRVAFGSDARSEWTANNQRGTNEKESATTAADARILKEHPREAARGRGSKLKDKRRVAGAENTLLANKVRRRHQQKRASSKSESKDEHDGSEQDSSSLHQGSSDSEGVLSQLWPNWLRPGIWRGSSEGQDSERRDKR